MRFLRWGMGEYLELRVRVSEPTSLAGQVRKAQLTRELIDVAIAHGGLQSWKTREEIFYGVVQKKEMAYFITDKDCSSLRRLEWGTKLKRKVSIQITGAGYPWPDTLDITHYTFPLQIRLTRLKKNDTSQ